MAIPTLGAMIAAIGSPAEWSAVAVADLMWDDSSKILRVVGDFYNVPWSDYTSSATWVGFNPATPNQWAWVYYKRIGKVILIHFNFYGTSNTTTMKLSLPVSAVANDVFLA